MANTGVAAGHRPGRGYVRRIVRKMLRWVIVGGIVYAGIGLWPALTKYYGVSLATRNLVNDVAQGKRRQAAIRELLRQVYHETGIVLVRDAVSIKVDAGQAQGAVRFALPVKLPLLAHTYRPVVTVRRSARAPSGSNGVTP